MLLSENSVRRVIRKTIVENNYRVNERFYQQLESNLIQEGIIDSIKGFAKRNGTNIIHALTLFSALAALNPSTKTNQIEDALAAKAGEISAELGSKLSIDQLSDLEDVSAGKLSPKKAKEILTDAEGDGVLANLVSQADAMGIKIDASIKSGFDEIDNMILQTQAEINAGYSGNDVGFERLRVDLADAGI